jgi:hypothetical protein
MWGKENMKNNKKTKNKLLNYHLGVFTHKTGFLGIVYSLHPYIGCKLLNYHIPLV